MTTYAVNSIYPCIQGEGTQTGVPMIMLRLQGCAVGCPWCDTKETWENRSQDLVSDPAVAFASKNAWTEMEPEEIVRFISNRYPGPRWVLLSGGEPAEQELAHLVSVLHAKRYQVALETSGTAFGHLSVKFDWVTVSPKLNMPGRKVVHKAATLAADEVKYPVGKPGDIENLCAMIAAGYFRNGVTVCLQPLSQSEAATKLCIKECLERGWRLSAQVHKYLNLP
jgi:7-carboxy-7-deazaguanine synthase